MLEELERVASKEEISFKIVYEGGQRTWYTATEGYVSKSYSELDWAIECLIDYIETTRTQVSR